MNGLRIGSLFSGIGGLELGLERAGVGQVVWQCEIDSWARGILAKHWPHAVRHDDIRTFQPAEGSADLLCGGFPCQDISQAGQGAGIQEGTRSGLWSEYVRIIRLVRPQFVLVENVAILRKRGLDRVLGDLAACGYDAEWDCIPAASVGAPHLRDRMFILAHRNDSGRLHGQAGKQPANAGLEALGQSQPGCQDLADPPGVGRTPRRAEPAELERQAGPARGSPLVGDPSSGGRAWALLHRQQGGKRHAPDAGWWATEPDVGRVANGVPARVDRIRGLGNAVVPQVAQEIGRRLIMACGNLGEQA